MSMFIYKESNKEHTKVTISTDIFNKSGDNTVYSYNYNVPEESQKFIVADKILKIMHDTKHTKEQKLRAINVILSMIDVPAKTFEEIFGENKN